MKPLTIRPALPQDAAGLAEVHALSWQEAYAGLLDPAYLKTRTVQRSFEVFRQNDCAQIWLAEQAGQIIGFCQIAEEENLGEILALYVRPGFQRQGIGRQLIHTGIQQLHQRGISTIVLWVLKSNHRARRFYESCGFTADHKEQTLTMGTPQTILRYRLTNKS